jgi:uncharacterized protein
LKKKIWIDLENSPHVLFFYPIVKELKRRNYEVVITARDYAQVFELADLLGLKYHKIGSHFGRNKVMKVIGLFTRSLMFLPFIKAEKPDLAFSHGSRTQLLASKISNLKCIITGDYEFGQQLPFINADMYLVPEVLYAKNIADHMQPARKFLSYPGIKEDVYVPSFKPNPINTLEFFGTKNGCIVAIIRPPANEAHYHKAESSRLFISILRFLCDHNDIKIIVTPRTTKQKSSIKKEFSNFIRAKKIIIPEHAVNGLDLIWYSDMVLSGGGTMIREAAALNVPAYSFFRGKIGAVDQYLVKTGKLHLIEKTDDIHSKIKLKHRDRLETSHPIANHSLESIVNNIENLIY